MEQMMNLPPISLPVEQQAQMLYFMKWAQKDIAKYLDIPETTLSSWKSRGKWDDITPYNQAINSLLGRLLYNLAKPKVLGNGELNEVQSITRALKKLTEPPKGAKESNHRGKSYLNNVEFDEEKFNSLILEKFMDDLYPFQREYIENIERYYNSRLPIARESMIIKLRQGGFTFNISRFNVKRLVEKEHNQIYMSSSKSQAFQAKSYVINFVREATGVELSGGDKIIFPNHKEFFFLGSNPSTAQGYSGDVTCDEYMWWRNFDELRAAVTGCSTHSQYITNYLSTASSKKHPGYRYWAGKEWNDHNPDQQFTVDRDYLGDGRICPDRRYRQIIDIHDAIRGGYDRINIDELRLKHPDPDEFANLFLCQFNDDIKGAFRYEWIYDCMVDSLEEWQDYAPFTYPHRPLGNKPVAIGYDPARNVDASVCVVAAVPERPGENFRLLEKHFWQGQDFEEQTQNMLDILNRYNVVHLGMDTTALGLAVGDRLERFYPSITRYDMNQDLKSQFILQARNIFQKKRVEIDFGDTDVISSFLSIQPYETRTRGLSYDSARNKDTGHADLSWAMMYLFGYEPFSGEIEQAESTIFSLDGY